MLAQMIWSTIVYLFLTSLGAPRTNKNNNVVNLYHQMFSFFHLLQLKGVSSLTSWIEMIKWREFDAAAEYVRVKCCLALACTVGLGIEEELILDQSRGAGFCLRFFSSRSSFRAPLVLAETRGHRLVRMKRQFRCWRSRLHRYEGCTWSIDKHFLVQKNPL